MRRFLIFILPLSLSYAALAQEPVEIAVFGASSVAGDTSAAIEAAALQAKLKALERAGLAIEASLDIEDPQKRRQWIEGWAQRVILPGYQTVNMGFGPDGLYYVSLFGKVNPGIFSQENIQGNNKFGTAVRLMVNDKNRALNLLMEVVNDYGKCESADDALFHLIVEGEFDLKGERLTMMKEKHPGSPLLPEAEKHVEEYGKTYTFGQIDFVKIPPGSLAVENSKRFIEGFFIQTTEVTQLQWMKIMGGNPSIDKGADRPVVNVSLRDAMEFAAKLNRAEKTKAYLIPDIYQWEYACRSGSAGKYCFGSDVETLNNYAWFNGNSENALHPAAEKACNYWGLYDVHGNAWEWCASPGKKAKKRGIIKGGSRASSPELLECSAGKEKSAKAQFIDAGFRLIRIIN